LLSTEVTSPVTWVVFAFSDFISVFFSIAGAGGVAGVAGVAGLAWAKLTPLKATVISTTTKTLSAFFTISPPFLY
jgi:hypothetical protein